MPTFEFEDGQAICILRDDNGRVYIGIANCHPEDKDMESEKTGCEIAYMRAKIKVLQQMRDEAKLKLGALNQTYYSMNRSKYFNPKSYETRMLLRQIRFCEDDLATAKEMLSTERENLKTYIQDKDKFYNMVRRNRKAKEIEKANS